MNEFPVYNPYSLKQNVDSVSLIYCKFSNELHCLIPQVQILQLKPAMLHIQSRVIPLPFEIRWEGVNSAQTDSSLKRLLFGTGSREDAFSSATIFKFRVKEYLFNIYYALFS